MTRLKNQKAAARIVTDSGAHTHSDANGPTTFIDGGDALGHWGVVYQTNAGKMSDARMSNG